MVSSTLKKYAKELGLDIEKGIAYGVHKGYMMTMKEGAGWKAVSFAVKFENDNSKASVQAMLLDSSFQKQYRISRCEITDSLISVFFANTIGTIKKVREAVDIIAEKMISSEVKGVSFCNACGLSFDGSSGEDVLLSGNAFRMHSGCIDKIASERAEIAETAKKQGNIITGIIGAVLGGIIGAIPWAVAYYAGWFVAWLGLLIGLAAKKGYEIFKGKETKVKGVVIIIVVLLTVIFAEYVSVLCYCANEWSEYGVSFMDSIKLLNITLVQSSESLLRFIFDIVIGWVFAGLGIYSTIFGIFRETSVSSSVPVRLGKKNNY